MVVSDTKNSWVVEHETTESLDESRSSIVAFLFGDTVHMDQLRMTGAVAEELDADIRIVRPHVVPEQTPLDLSPDEIEKPAAFTSTALDALDTLDTDVRAGGYVNVGHSDASVVEDAALRHDAVASTFGLIESIDIDTIVNASPCDILSVRSYGSLSDIDSILIAVSSGEHSRKAVVFGTLIARQTGADVRIFHALPPNSSGEAQKRVEARVTDYVDMTGLPASVDNKIVQSENAADAIVEESLDFDVTVIGGPDEGRLKRLAFGTTHDKVEEESPNPVLTAWDRGTIEETTDEF